MKSFNIRNKDIVECMSRLLRQSQGDDIRDLVHYALELEKQNLELSRKLEVIQTEFKVAKECVHQYQVMSNETI